MSDSVLALEDEPDDKLLVLVEQRRSPAFEELYRRHAPAVAAVVRRSFGDADLVSEVTHVAFMQLWDGRAVNPGGRLRAWLVKVAYNAAIDRRRRKTPSTVPIVDALDRATDVPGPDEVAVVNEQRRDVRAALAELPDVQRSAIELSYFGGLTQAEIADLTGEPLGTIKGRIRLGMRRLRALITATGETA